MSILQIIILAVIQGIAEFLPISSSGHLVVASALMGGSRMDDVTDVNIVLHLGTLFSIVVFYAARIRQLLREDRRVIPLLIVGTIPAAVIGVIVKKKFGYLLEDPLLAGVMLIVTATVLLITHRTPVHDGHYRDMSWKSSLWIGCSQAIALLPGISRSGMTICSGIFQGLSRSDAAAFSFLLAIPAIGGASVLELSDLVSGAEVSTKVSYLAIGAACSFLVGLVSLYGLLRVLERDRLQYFAYWCATLGVGVVVWQLSM